MASQGQGSFPIGGGPPTRKSSDNIERSGRFAGLGILSIDPAVTRERSYTLDSLNISPIENLQHGRIFVEDTPIDDLDMSDEGAPVTGLGGVKREVDPNNNNLEKATWEFSDILQSLSVKDKDDLHGIISKCNQLVPLLAAHPSLKKEIVIENVVAKIQFMLYHTRSQVRSAAYRLLRHTSGTADALLHLVQLKTLIFIIVSLSTPTPLLEKEEALKLVREFVNVPGGVQYLSVGIIKSLVAYIEHVHDDPQQGELDVNASHESYGFTRMCIETVTEIAVLNPELAFHGGGIRLLINLTINGSTDISLSCITTLLTLLDMPHARRFLRNGADLDCLMSVFTLFEDDEDVSKITLSKKYYTKALKMSFILSCLLKTWSGLICFSHDNFDPMKMLLSNLKKRNTKLCNIILDLLLDILRIKQLPWVDGSPLGEIISQFYASTGNDDKDTPSEGPGILFDFQNLEYKSFEYGVISHYQGLLAKILINCGLLPLLFSIVNENRNKETTEKAILLFTNFYDLCSKTLPIEFYESQVLNAYNTGLSLTSWSKIEAATKIMQKANQNPNSVDVKVIIRDMNQKMRADIKDTSFKALISGTKVLSAKEFEEWNWSLLSQLCQGPLRNASRFVELQEKYPKFLKTILAFLRPFKYRFSSIPITASSKFPKIRKPRNVLTVACQLIEGLLATEKGSSFLSSNKLMLQIAEIFAQVDPLSGGVGSKDPILNKRRLEHSLSIGYVKMVGILSGTPRGVEILKYWQLFTMISNILEGTSNNESNNHLVFHLLQNLNYTEDGHAREILSKAMNISNWKVKVFALENILPQLCLLKGCEEFLVFTLVNLMYDEDDVVLQMAVALLHEYFIEENHLQLIDLLVDCLPRISILNKSKEGQILLLHMCQTSKGFKHLDSNGFIEESFHRNLERLRSLEYLQTVESILRQLLFPFSRKSTDLDYSSGLDKRHFFYYLLETEEGFNYFNSHRSFIDEAVNEIREICRILNIIKTHDESDYFGSREPVFLADKARESNSLSSKDSPIEQSITANEFWPPSANWAVSAEYISEASSPTSVLPGTPDELATHDDAYLLQKLKQYIWIVGEISSARFGINILDPVYTTSPRKEHIAETFCRLFQQASHWQLRGLAFFQLGKMARTVEGVEILDELKWVSLNSSQTCDMSLAYPQFMQEETFTEVEVLNPYKDATYYSLFGRDEQIQVNEHLDLEDEIVIESFEEVDEKILSLFNYLGSVLGRIERKAVKELNRIKTETPQVFDSTSLFLKTIRLVDRGKFKYRARLFIFDLFNSMKILEGLMKKDRKNSIAKRSAG